MVDVSKGNGHKHEYINEKMSDQGQGLSPETSLKRVGPEQSEDEETTESRETKKRRCSQTLEIIDEEKLNTASDTRSNNGEILSANEETFRNGQVPTDDVLPVAHESLQNVSPLASDHLEANNETSQTVPNTDAADKQTDEEVATTEGKGVEKVENENEIVEKSTESTAASVTSKTESDQTANPEATQPSSSSDNSVNNTQNNQECPATTQPVRKANFRYDKLYRLLRPNENPTQEGIKAQEPNSNFTIHKHVSEGSSFGTQYISTSASWDSMVAFARNKKACRKRIATIDVVKLEDCGGATFIDLTDASMRERHLNDQRAKNLTRKYDEVLIKGVVPASCILDVQELYMPNSESYDLDWDSDDDSDDSDDDYGNYRRRKRRRHGYYDSDDDWD